MLSQSLYHLLCESETIDSPALREYRYTVGKESGLLIERNQSAIEQVDENRIARMTVNQAAHIRPRAVNRRVDRCVVGDGASPGDPFTLEVDGANIFGIGQHSGESGIDKKGLGSVNSRAQMA